MRLAGITTVEAANAWLKSHYIAEHNARFAVAPEQEGSAFVADAHEMWREILCVVEERTVGKRQHRGLERKRLQLPESRLRPHFVKAQVKVHEYPDGTCAVFLGPHRLADYDAEGAIRRPNCDQAWRRARGRQGQALTGALARVLDRPCARRQFALAGRDEETAAQPNKETAANPTQRRSPMTTSEAGRPRLPTRFDPHPKPTLHTLQKHDRLTRYGQRRGGGQDGGRRAESCDEFATFHVRFSLIRSPAFVGSVAYMHSV